MLRIKPHALHRLCGPPVISLLSFLNLRSYPGGVLNALVAHQAPESASNTLVPSFTRAWDFYCINLFAPHAASAVKQIESSHRKILHIYAFHRHGIPLSPFCTQAKCFQSILVVVSQPLSLPVSVSLRSTNPGQRRDSCITQVAKARNVRKITPQCELLPLLAPVLLLQQSYDPVPSLTALLGSPPP